MVLSLLALGNLAAWADLKVRWRRRGLRAFNADATAQAGREEGERREAAVPATG